MKDFNKALKTFLKSFGIGEVEPVVEKMQEISVVYVPDEKDAHGQWMSPSTIEDAMINFNKNLKDGVVKSNLFHIQDTELFTVEDTWIQKEFDVTVAETGEIIKAGTWVAKVQYNDPDLWELRKAGVIGGLSIGGKGFVDEETGEITEVTFDGDEE